MNISADLFSGRGAWCPPAARCPRSPVPAGKQAGAGRGGWAVLGGGPPTPNSHPTLCPYHFLICVQNTHLV